MIEMEIDIWQFFVMNPSIIIDWIIYCVGIFLSILYFKKNPKKFTLTLISLLTWLLLSIGNLLVFLGISSFASLINQGENQEIFGWITDIFGVLSWVALFFAIFSQDNNPNKK